MWATKSFQTADDIAIVRVLSSIVGHEPDRLWLLPNLQFGWIDEGVDSSTKSIIERPDPIEIDGRSLMRLVKALHDVNDCTFVMLGDGRQGLTAEDFLRHDPEEYAHTIVDVYGRIEVKSQDVRVIESVSDSMTDATGTSE